MHRDFHYWATFMAARAAGVRSDHALEIAEYAELVDEAIEGKGPDKNTYIEKNNDNFHWKPQYWISDKHVQRTASAVFVQRIRSKRPEQRTLACLDLDSISLPPEPRSARDRL